MGFIEIDWQKTNPTGLAFINNLQCCQDAFVLCRTLVTHLQKALHPRLGQLLAHNGSFCIQIPAADGKDNCIELQRTMHLEPAEADAGDNICRRVRFRKHIFDLEAAVNIPLWNPMLLHSRHMLLSQ